jgi:hypothetical protein
MSQEIPKKVCNSCFYKLPATEFYKIKVDKPKLRDTCRTCESWARAKMRSKDCTRCDKNKPLTAYVNIMNDDQTECEKLSQTCLACYREDFRKILKRKRLEETRNLAHFEKFVMK